MRLFLFFFLLVQILSAQELYTVKAVVLDSYSKKYMHNALVTISNLKLETTTSNNGSFELKIPKLGEYILHISLLDYVTKKIPITIESKDLDLGVLYVEKDITIEKSDNLISLTDTNLSDDENNAISLGLLQATKDVFLNRAAFDFGQAFFRVRGYGSEQGQVFINGLPMNNFFDGRPQWNNWGGLNDVTRNQEFSHGLQASEFAFGGILGATNINMRPSKMRGGFRLSTSVANRTYAGRLMATYNSGKQANGLSYSLSSSRRWAKEGYINGTLYDAYSFFGALEYQINDKNALSFTSIIASNRRGRSSAITEEVFHLVGRKYNPYWGLQDGKIRNSRERKIAEPIFLLNHFYTSDKFQLNTGISYQFGINARSRLGYFNASNPDPTYYRYLPSFYINSSIGANFIGANLAKDAFLNNPQLNWNNVYTANNNNEEKAAYVLSNDVVENKKLTINTTGNLKLSEGFKIDFGCTYKNLMSDNYAEIKDMLGASFHEDIDVFSNTENNVDGNILKLKGDKFGYNYIINAAEFNAFTQLKIDYKKWSGFVAATYSRTNYQREGLFKNERFLDNSLGKSKSLTFSNYKLKLGLTYQITGRHWLALHGATINTPPTIQNTFINPRDNSQIVPNIKNEKISTTDFNYYIRLPKLTGRITGFYTRFKDATDINFFFTESGVGSDFVQEVITGIEKQHLGTELGLEYQVSSSVKLSAVAAVGKYTYANNPSVTINFDTAGIEEDILDAKGNIDLGTAAIKDYKLAQGPQKAFAFGVEYRDPKYWWLSATTNYLANNYANISTITRTQSFFINPETGENFPNATQDNVAKLLAQNRLDNFYLLNLVGGKSWIVDGKYISVFASINNVFDTVFRTGGYEQSRNGNYGELSQDNLSGTPSFAPKYWYGYGRTYFLNVAVSF